MMAQDDIPKQRGMDPENQMPYHLLRVQSQLWATMQPSYWTCDQVLDQTIEPIETPYVMGSGL